MNPVEKELRLEIAKKALREISRGEGEFSRDHMTHAKNTIENMKRLAIDALREIGEVT